VALTAQCAANDLLGLALAVHIGCINSGHTYIERALDHLNRARLVGTSAKVVRPQTDH